MKQPIKALLGDARRTLRGLEHRLIMQPLSVAEAVEVQRALDGLRAQLEALAARVGVQAAGDASDERVGFSRRHRVN